MSFSRIRKLIRAVALLLVLCIIANSSSAESWVIPAISTNLSLQNNDIFEAQALNLQTLFSGRFQMLREFIAFRQTLSQKIENSSPPQSSFFEFLRRGLAAVRRWDTAIETYIESHPKTAFVALLLGTGLTQAPLATLETLDIVQAKPAPIIPVSVSALLATIFGEKTRDPMALIYQKLTKLNPAEKMIFFKYSIWISTRFDNSKPSFIERIFLGRSLQGTYTAPIIDWLQRSMEADTTGTLTLVVQESLSKIGKEKLKLLESTMLAVPQTFSLDLLRPIVSLAQINATERDYLLLPNSDPMRHTGLERTYNLATAAAHRLGPDTDDATMGYSLLSSLEYIKSGLFRAHNYENYAEMLATGLNTAAEQSLMDLLGKVDKSVLYAKNFYIARMENAEPIHQLYYLDWLIEVAESYRELLSLRQGLDGVKEPKPSPLWLDMEEDLEKYKRTRSFLTMKILRSTDLTLPVALDKTLLDFKHTSKPQSIKIKGDESQTIDIPTAPQKPTLAMQLFNNLPSTMEVLRNKASTNLNTLVANAISPSEIDAWIKYIQQLRMMTNDELLKEFRRVARSDRTLFVSRVTPIFGQDAKIPSFAKWIANKTDVYNTFFDLGIALQRAQSEKKQEPLRHKTSQFSNFARHIYTAAFLAEFQRRWKQKETARLQGNSFGDRTYSAPAGQRDTFNVLIVSSHKLDREPRRKILGDLQRTHVMAALNIVEVEDAETAAAYYRLALAMRQPFDLVLTERSMAGLEDGYWLAQYIWSFENTLEIKPDNATRTILLAGNNPPEGVGIVALVSKDDPDALRESIIKLFDLKPKTIALTQTGDTVLNSFLGQSTWELLTTNPITFFKLLGAAIGWIGLLEGITGHSLFWTAASVALLLSLPAWRNLIPLAMRGFRRFSRAVIVGSSMMSLAMPLFPSAFGSIQLPGIIFDHTHTADGKWSFVMKAPDPQLTEDLTSFLDLFIEEIKAANQNAPVTDVNNPLYLVEGFRRDLGSAGTIHSDETFTMAPAITVNFWSTKKNDTDTVLNYRMFINQDLLSRLLKKSQKYPVYRQWLSMLVLKEGATIEHIRKNPMFYDQWEKNRVELEQLSAGKSKKMDPERMGRMADEMIESEAVGYRWVLLYMEVNHINPSTLRALMFTTNDPWVKALLNRYANLADAVDGTSGKERERRLRRNIFEIEIRNAWPELYNQAKRLKDNSFLENTSTSQQPPQIDSGLSLRQNGGRFSDTKSIALKLAIVGLFLMSLTPFTSHAQTFTGPSLQQSFVSAGSVAGDVNGNHSPALSNVDNTFNTTLFSAKDFDSNTDWDDQEKAYAAKVSNFLAVHHADIRGIPITYFKNRSHAVGVSLLNVVMRTDKENHFLGYEIKINRYYLSTKEAPGLFERRWFHELFHILHHRQYLERQRRILELIANSSDVTPPPKRTTKITDLVADIMHTEEEIAANKYSLKKLSDEGIVFGKNALNETQQYTDNELSLQQTQLKELSASEWRLIDAERNLSFEDLESPKTPTLDTGSHGIFNKTLNQSA